MSIEGSLQDKLNQEMERRFAEKEPRLPKSIRIYIRRLKEEGKFQEALRIRESTIQAKRTRLEKAQDELNKTASDLLTTGNPNIEIAREAKAIWLLEAIGELKPEERLEELTNLLDSVDPKTQTYLEEVLPTIRDEVKPLLSPKH